MFNYESFRFMFIVFLGNLAVYMVLIAYDFAFGAIRRYRIDAMGIAPAGILLICLSMLGVRELDIPGALVPRHEEMEGVVCYFEEEDIDSNTNIVGGGTVHIIDDETGRVYRFRDVWVPQKLCLDDRVRVLYLKNYRTGAVVEINGEKTWYRIDNDKPLGIVLILFLLASVPFYYLWVMKIKPFFHYQKDYSIYAYRDIYIRSMKILYPVMLLGAAVLLTAVLGYYRTSWDRYWGRLLLAGYAGIFGVSYLHQKRFVIMEGKFYYAGFKKWYEGSLEEIERVEKTEGGIVIHAGEKEMEILCSSEQYLEPLLKRLPVKVRERSEG